MKMRELRFNKNYKKGQTLTEALIALALVTLVISAVTITTLNSLNASQTSKSQNLASQFAQEGLELARKERGKAAGTYCVGDGATTLGSPGSCTGANLAAEYRRQVIVQGLGASVAECGTNTYRVQSIVAWSDGKCTAAFCRNVTLTSCLTP